MSLFSSFKEHTGGFGVQSISAIAGLSLAFGNYVPYLHVVDIRHEYVLEGSNFEKAVGVFAQRILKDAFMCDEFSGVLVDSFCIEQPQRAQAKSPYKTWSISKIKASKQAFAKEIKVAAQKRRRCFLGAYILLSDDALGLGNGDGARFVKCTKRYTMHFRPSSTTKARSSSAFPLETLIEGVFDSHEDANEYAKLFRAKEKPAFDDDSRKSHRAGATTALQESFMRGSVVESCEHALLLSAWKNDSGELRSLRMMFNSAAGKLRALRIENEAMLNVMTVCERSSSSVDPSIMDKVADQVTQYKKRIMGVFRMDSVHQMSALRPFVQTAVQQFRASNFGKRARRQRGLAVFFAKHLKRLFHILGAVEMNLGKDISFCSSLASFLNGGEDFPEDLSHLALGYIDVDLQSKKLGQSSSKRYPAHLLREAVIMQYIVDTRLDKAMQEMFSSLMNGEALATNPTSYVLGAFQARAMRQAAWRETDASIERRLLPFSARDRAKTIADPDTFVHESAYECDVDGVDGVYGSRSAMQLVHRSVIGLWRRIADGVTIDRPMNRGTTKLQFARD